MEEKFTYFEVKHWKNLIKYLDTLKWDKTAGHLSQSSCVIRYVLTRLLTISAISGVALTPGDRENTIGLWKPLIICIHGNSNDNTVLHVLALKWKGKEWWRILHYTSDTVVISPKSRSSPNTQSSFTVTNQSRKFI